MRLTPDLVIAGVPARRLRDALRYCGDYPSTGLIAHSLGMSEVDTQALVDRLIEDGWLSRDNRGDLAYTDRGVSLSLALALPPITRARADRVLADTIRVAGEIAADGTSPLYVDELVVYGSYLDPRRATLGDLDVAVSLERRLGDVLTLDSWCDWQQAYTRRHGGSSNRTILGRLAYAETSTLRRLRQRRAHLSLTMLDDYLALEAPGRSVYRATDVAPPQVLRG